jgi:transposase
MSELGYSRDFRDCVLAYLSRGHTMKSACEIFQINRKTIYNWKRLLSEHGHCNPIVLSRRKSRKIDDKRLLEYINDNPDAILEEISKEFSCSINSIWKRLKKLGITRKKNHSIQRARRGKKARVSI